MLSFTQKLFSKFGPNLPGALALSGIDNTPLAGVGIAFDVATLDGAACHTNAPPTNAVGVSDGVASGRTTCPDA